ncbi:hypothetical protein B0A55_05005 [Friedmanniomyces simplex]|uniref:Uncharacterized protein n=1 Tax=Friedmanniomyces simplex TaxID=329884 RepID=A0A4U0XJT9_9PEZI|nr:hypothetical protein B0A55_05005 [Friedmanniomyces simplex]
MTPAIRPRPSTWILRFKHHRTTILLHVDPLQKLSSVRAELLKAVRQTCPHGTLNGHTVPDDEGDVLLARPVDSDDLSLGWQALEREDEVEKAVKEDAKGKGKAAVGSSANKAGKDKLTACPQGVGLQDGGVVAFKFRSELDAVARDKDEGIEVEEDDEDRLDGETLVGAGGPPEKWDVVVPTLEETYGDALPLAGDGAEGEGGEELLSFPPPATLG